ncbi:MAG: 1-acyl-sn-glycerol-3-phosphate acyltransferase [Hydrotalea sp.]|nr:1-acyl-sn-glycerol-3-phosphate acyltransferase [Hydrotalea sp.]
MRLIKNIFARVWAVWGLITFAATFLLFFLPSMATYLIPNPRGQAIFLRIAAIWMRVWLTLIGCTLKVRGKENFKKGIAYIVTCNHNSFMDVPLSCPFIPGANRTIAKKSFTKVPIFGWYYAKGSVLVDRKSEQSRRKSFELMLQTLREGMHMSIYPEGTRNRTNEPLKKFYDGAFKLSVASGAPIIPSVIFNTKKILPPNKPMYLVPGPMEIHFLEPIEPANLSSDELKDKVFEVMKNYYVAGTSK